MAWGWLEFLLHPERPEKAESQFLGVQSRAFTQSIKLTIELPEHSNNKLPQRLGENRTSTHTIIISTLTKQDWPFLRLLCCPQSIKNIPYLWLAVLLNPAENTGGEFLEAAHWNRIAERLEQGVHDALKDVELDLVRHLILSLLWVGLVSLHYVLIVPIKKDNHCSLTKYTNLINGHDCFIKKWLTWAIHPYTRRTGLPPQQV